MRWISGRRRLGTRWESPFLPSNCTPSPHCPTKPLSSSPCQPAPCTPPPGSLPHIPLTLGVPLTPHSANGPWPTPVLLHLRGQGQGTLSLYLTGGNSTAVFYLTFFLIIKPFFFNNKISLKLDELQGPCLPSHQSHCRKIRNHT